MEAAAATPDAQRAGQRTLAGGTTFAPVLEHGADDLLTVKSLP